MASLVIKSVLVIFLLLFMDMSSGRVKGFVEVKPAFPTNEGHIVEKKMIRKLVALDDYGKPEHNPKHDFKKPGGPGKR